MSCTVPTIRSGAALCAVRRRVGLLVHPAHARRPAGPRGVRCRRAARRRPPPRWPRAPRRDRPDGRSEKNDSDDPANWPGGTPKMRWASADQSRRSDPSSSATQLPMCATSCACSRNGLMLRQRVRRCEWRRRCRGSSPSGRRCARPSISGAMKRSMTRPSLKRSMSSRTVDGSVQSACDGRRAPRQDPRALRRSRRRCGRGRRWRAPRR